MWLGGGQNSNFWTSKSVISTFSKNNAIFRVISEPKNVIFEQFKREHQPNTRFQGFKRSNTSNERLSVPKIISRVHLERPNSKSLKLVEIQPKSRIMLNYKKNHSEWLLYVCQCLLLSPRGQRTPKTYVENVCRWIISRKVLFLLFSPL